MAHQINDIVEVSYRGLCENQMILNVWHYIVTNSSSQSTDIADNGTLAGFLRAQTAEDQITKEFLDLMPTNYELRYVRAQKVAPIRSTYAESLSGVLGFQGTLSNNTNTAAVITKQGTSGTRRATGSIHLGPVPESAHVRGKLDPLHVQAMSNFAAVWTSSFVVPSNNISYRPVIYNPGAIPNYQFLSGYVIQDTLRVVRRRTVGQGK